LIVFLRGFDLGKWNGKVALRFQVSESWDRRIKQQRPETGKFAPATTFNKQFKWAVQANAI
jgi:hypothetical protein